MNIEQLKQKLAEQVTTVDGFRLGLLNAKDAMEFSERFADIPADASFEQTVDAYAFLLSKSIVSDSGKRELDSDEGRSALAELGQELFCRLGEAAIAWNFGDSKKKN